MAQAKQVMDFRPGKSFTTAQSNEHLRNWTEKGWLSAIGKGNYDRSREIQVYKKVGVVAMLANNICAYADTSLMGKLDLVGSVWDSSQYITEVQNYNKG